MVLIWVALARNLFKAQHVVFFIFNLTYKLNNFKPKASEHELKMGFDSGLDH